MIILTGGCGFIGSNVLAHLNSLGQNDIIVVDRLGNSSEKWKNLQGKSFRDYVHKDQFISRLQAGGFDKLEAVIHLGACSSTTEQDADYLYNNNYQYSKDLADYCFINGIRFIYASSAATYGAGEYGYDDQATTDRLRPLNMYGFSKHLFDQYLAKTGGFQKAVGLKFFNVYGPNEAHKGRMASMVFHSYKQIVAERRVKLFKSYRPDYRDGEQKRDFVYVKDCARIIAELLQNSVCGLYNLGSGTARSWNDLAAAVFKALSLPVNIEYIDMPEDLRGQYQYFTEAKMEKLQAAFPEITSTRLEDGIKDYVTNYLRTGVTK